MKLIVDAQLPRRLAYLLRKAGHDVLHTLDLTLRNKTPDELINRLSMDEERLVVTKDTDFVNSHLLRGEPYKLLLVSTGNLGNDELLWLFEQSFGQLVEAFRTHSYIELSRSQFTIHQ